MTSKKKIYLMCGSGFGGEGERRGGGWIRDSSSSSARYDGRRPFLVVEDFLFLPDLNQRVRSMIGTGANLESGNYLVSAQKNTLPANSAEHSPGFGGLDFWRSSSSFSPLR